LLYATHSNQPNCLFLSFTEHQSEFILDKGNVWTDKMVSVENGSLVLRAEETFTSNGTRELLQAQVYSKYAAWSEGK
jgi:hypothetical protein